MKPNNLPFALKLAGRATSLDNIKVKPVNFDTEVRGTMSTLKFWGWQKRLLDQAVNFVNNDIDNSPTDSTIQIYGFGGKFYRTGIWMNTDLKYNIISK